MELETTCDCPCEKPGNPVSNKTVINLTQFNSICGLCEETIVAVRYLLWLVLIHRVSWQMLPSAISEAILSVACVIVTINTAARIVK